tara:strand:- start:158 stop:385 length:228 start_codon:yes stop_codon:yes gene_type:complete
MINSRLKMSGEQTSIDSSYGNVEVKPRLGKKTNKVDINHLLNRVRKEKKKEKIEGYIFLGLISSIILVGGIIISL